MLKSLNRRNKLLSAYNHSYFLILYYQNMNIKSFLILLTCISLLACNTDRRTPFKLIGKVNNLNGTQVSLEQLGIVYDVATVENDTFSLSGKLTSMEMCEVVFKGDGFKNRDGIITRWKSDVSIFVEKGASYIFTAESPADILYRTYKVKSTGLHQNAWAKYNDCEQQLRKAIKAKLNELNAKTDMALRLRNDSLYGIYLDSIRKYENRLMQSQNMIYRKLIAENPNTYAAIYILSTSYDIPNDVGFYQGIYDRLDRTFKNHDYGKTFKTKLEEVKKQH